MVLLQDVLLRGVLYVITGVSLEHLDVFSGINL